MTRNTLIAVGAVLVVFGGVWFLQGIDVLGGSGMSGETTWAVIGPIVALVGVVVLIAGFRRPSG
jgi:drug/metabolite transporter superfamily protein YnfA